MCAVRCKRRAVTRRGVCDVTIFYLSLCGRGRPAGPAPGRRAPGRRGAARRPLLGLTGGCIESLNYLYSYVYFCKIHSYSRQYYTILKSIPNIIIT